MKTPDGFGPSHNAQAAVEIESRLLVGVNVSDAPNDKGHPRLDTSGKSISQMMMASRRSADDRDRSSNRPWSPTWD